MKDNTAIHVLAKPNVKSGKITFICPDDGKEHTFGTAVNKLSGDRMTWLDSDYYVNDPVSYVKSVFRKIRARAKVISCIGDF